MGRLARHMRLLQAVSLVFGIALFVYLIYRVGVYEILGSIRLIGFGFVVLMLVTVIRYLVRSFAWYYCIEKDQRNISIFTLFNARLAGDAVRLLSFSGPFLGEPSKAFLVRDRLPIEYGAPSIVVENLCFMLTGVFIIVSGLLLFATNFTLQNSVKVAGAVLSILMIASVVAINYGIKHRIKGITVSIDWLARKTGIVWLENRSSNFAEMEDKIFDFYNRRGSVLYGVIFLESVAQFINVFEIYLILYLLKTDVTAIIAYITEAVTKVVNLIFFFVPGQIGVAEGGSAFILQILGLGVAAGVTLILIEKIRTIFWVAYGLVVWILAFRKNPKLKSQKNSVSSNAV